MYRPHPVAPPFPLMGLCLKVVPLLLPRGSSTRKVLIARHVMNSMKKHEKDRVQVKRFIPRPSSTPFYQVRLLWNVAHFFYEPIRRPDLTFLYLFFAWQLVGYNIIWEKKKEPPPKSCLGMDTQNTCANIYGLFLKNRIRHLFRLFCGKRVYFS